VNRDQLPPFKVVTLDGKQCVQFQASNPAVEIIRGDIIKSAGFRGIKTWKVGDDDIDTLVYNLDNRRSVQSLTLESTRNDLQSDVIIIAIEAVEEKEYDCFQIKYHLSENRLSDAMVMYGLDGKTDCRQLPQVKLGTNIVKEMDLIAVALGGTRNSFEDAAEVTPPTCKGSVLLASLMMLKKSKGGAPQSWYERYGYKIEATPLQEALQEWITNVRNGKMSPELKRLMETKFKNVQMYLNFTAKAQDIYRSAIKNMKWNMFLMLVKLVKVALGFFPCEGELKAKCNKYKRRCASSTTDKKMQSLTPANPRVTTVGEVYQDLIAKGKCNTADILGNIYLHLVNYGQWGGPWPYLMKTNFKFVAPNRRALGQVNNMPTTSSLRFMFKKMSV